MKSDHNFKKHFGQNFITSFDHIFRVIDSLEIKPEDNFIEIGPGDGRFTFEILERGANLTVIEIDDELILHLSEAFEEQLESGQLQIVAGNVLDIDLKRFGDKKYKVFGALPYNISKKIIANFLECNLDIEFLTFITQKEVAEDYAAEAPKSSFLHNYVRAFGEIEYIDSIPKEYFHPKPKVDGGVIKITPYENESDVMLPVLRSSLPSATLVKEDSEGGRVAKNEDESYQKVRTKFIKFLKASFLNQRKKLTNNLKSRFDKEAIQKAYSEVGLNENARAAELKFEDWVELYKRLT